jgi:hypothetical protein
VHGANATRSLDAFVTQMANAASKLSREEGRRFCERTKDALRTLSTLALDALPTYASNWPRATAHGQSVCTGKMLAQAEEEEKLAAASVSEAKPEEPAASKGTARADWYMWQ